MSSAEISGFLALLVKSLNFSIGSEMMAAQTMDLGGRKMSRISYHQNPAADNAALSKSMDRRNLTLKSRSSRRGVEPLGRSSLRSKGSSSNSGSGATDKVKMLKNCLRTMAEFMCAQVGVGSIMVCYTIVGASIFQVHIIIKDFFS